VLSRTVASELAAGLRAVPQDGQRLNNRHATGCGSWCRVGPLLPACGGGKGGGDAGLISILIVPPGQAGAPHPRRLRRRYRVGARQPAVQVDVGAAARTERTKRSTVVAADGARFCVVEGTHGVNLRFPYARREGDDPTPVSS